MLPWLPILQKPHCLTIAQHIHCLLTKPSTIWSHYTGARSVQSAPTTWLCRRGPSIEPSGTLPHLTPSKQQSKSTFIKLLEKCYIKCIIIIIINSFQYLQPKHWKAFLLQLVTYKFKYQGVSLGTWWGTHGFGCLVNLWTTPTGRQSLSGKSPVPVEACKPGVASFGGIFHVENPFTSSVWQVRIQSHHPDGKLISLSRKGCFHKLCEYCYMS